MESFDDMIRRKLAEQPVPDFEEKYWLGAEKLLDQADRKRRRGLIFWIWPLTGLLLVGLGFYIGFSVKNRDTSIVEINKNPSEKIDKNQRGQSEIDLKTNGFIDEKRSGLNKNHSLNPVGSTSAKSSEFNKKGADKQGGNPLAELKIGTKNQTAETDDKVVLNDQNPSIFVEKTTGDLVKIDEKLSTGSPVILDKKSAQNIDNQSIAEISKVLFMLELLETRAGEKPLIYVRKMQKFPFFKAEFPPVLQAKVDKNRVRFGLQIAGFSSMKDNLNKRVYGGQVGIFAQKKLFNRFEAQLFVDYKVIAGLNNSFSIDNNFDSVKQYRFGLESVNGEVIPILFHHVVPGVNLRYNFYGKQWAEIGFSERIWYGSRIQMNQNSISPFGTTLTEDKLKGYSTKNYGWNKIVPELRLGWASNLGQNLQVSVGYNRQFKPLPKIEDLAPGRYYSKNWFDVKLRYILY